MCVFFFVFLFLLFGDGGGGGGGGGEGGELANILIKRSKTKDNNVE